MIREKWSNKKVLITLTSCILIMLLVFCTVINFTFAWLSATIEKTSDGGSNLAGLKDNSIVTKNNVIEVTLNSVAGTATDLNASTKIKNNGNVGALLRVFYSFVIDETSKKIATTEDFSNVKLMSNFIASEENIDGVYGGYYFYNKVLEAGQEVGFIDKIYPTSTIAGTTIKLNFYYELVNFDGGAYQFDQELPWKNTPASWFLNYNIITKPSGSAVTPKIPVKFSEISKIELTAKTTDTSKNILLSRNGGAYIGIDGGAWKINSLSVSPSMTVSDFTDGDFHTITFTVNSCDDSSGDYISLAWDSTWSKEVSYKQIRIWNKSNELVCDLRPHKVVNRYTVDFLDGTFENVVDSSTLDMYEVTGTTFEFTSATTVYDIVNEIVFENTYDAYSDNESMAASSGATAVVTSETSKNGGKCVKVTDAYDENTIEYNSPARLGWMITQRTAKAGDSYNVSMWVKTTAPEGTMAYYFVGGKKVAIMPCIQIGGSQNKSVSLDKYGEWTFISVKTSVLSSDEQLNFCFVIPTGTQYTTYIDDVRVTIAKS